VGFATTSVPASLAAAAAILGIETWADTRAAALDEKSRDALEEFVVKSTLVISRGLDLEGADIPMRANIVTWGSPELLRKLTERTRFIDDLGKEFASKLAMAHELVGDPNAPVTIDIGDRKAQLAQLTAEAISIARGELGMPAVSAEDVYGVLYGRVNGREFSQIPPLGPHLPPATVDLGSDT